MLFSKYLNKYYLKYGWLILFGVIVTIIVDYVQLYVPEYLGDIVALFDLKSTVVFTDIKDIVINLVIVAFVLFLGRFGWRMLIFRASMSIEKELRQDMFSKAERLSQRFYHENKVGSIMAWFSTDLEAIEEYIGWGSIMTVDSTFLSFLVIYKMIKMDYVLTIVVIIPMILLIFWGAIAEKFMVQKWEDRQKHFDMLYDFTQENFTGIRVIKAFVKELKEIHAFNKVAIKNADKNIEFAKLNILLDVCIEIIITFVIALTIGLGGYFVYSFVSGSPIVIFNHTVSLNAGKLTTFIGYVESLIWPMIAMGQIVSMRSRSKGSLKRITEYMNQEEEVHSPKDAIELKDVKGKITFKHFNFNYPDTDKDSLKDICLEIMPGELVGIVGKIGSGKSTLVSTLLRLYNVKDGTLFIDDVDIMKANIQSVRDNISYVPQDNFLFSDEIKNNIAFSNRKVNFEKIKEAAIFADIDENIVGFENGYDTVTGERGVTLSGGQKQRISIARAYIKGSPIMIMDDSVSAVDVKTEETILDHIRNNRKGKTTLIIASRVSTVAHLDKIIVLNDGKLEAFGTPSELLEKSPTYKKMYLLQQLDRES